jgi:hypothetical protein
MTEESVDVEKHVKQFYEQNPFYPKWPWGQLTKIHWKRMEKDNEWYKKVSSLREIEKYDPAPF